MMMRVRRRSRPLVTACCMLGMVMAAVLLTSSRTSAQVAPATGQNIAAVYEGWEQNPDRSYNLLFGYFNRNYTEEIDVPIGPDNKIEPGELDQGQPTHFAPRRNRFVFKVRVPEDFGDKELVWTLTSHGETERAYGTLHPEYFVDDIVIMNNNGAGGGGGGAYNIIGNNPPRLEVEGDKTRRSVKVGQPVTLTAFASDDGVPKRRAMRPPRVGNGQRQITPDSASGLRLAWFVYRGAGTVTFDPPQIKVWEDHRDGANSAWSAGWEPPPVPPDGKWMVRATFSDPGTYVLRCLAHDGGLMTHEDVTVVVVNR